MNDTKTGTFSSTLRRWSALAAAAAIVLGLSGCADAMRRRQLHRVAKDWCETIRASQVIPVYPLTEDLHPGDVFLVQRSIAEQHKEWKGRGFLALDDHRVRLKDPATPSETLGPEPWFKSMYFDAYWKDEFGTRFHPRPKNELAGPIKPDTENGDSPSDVAANRRAEAEAPRAAFPSYSFKVRTGTGLGVALPVKGVPVGLSYMQSADADGTVTLADAYTYAADSTALYDAVRDWAKNTAQQRSLHFAAKRAKDSIVFLRVVTRVYLVGSVAVSLQSSQSGGAGVTAGSGVDSPAAATGDDASKRREAILEMLDARANEPFPLDATNKLIPGGSVKFAWATERSISMNETFPTPLVVGYLAFDIPVTASSAEGFVHLGRPMPTWGILNNQVPIPTSTTMAELTPPERTAQLRLDALEGLFARRPSDLALGTVRDIGHALGTERLKALSLRASDLLAAQDADRKDADVARLWSDFRDEVNAINAQGGPPSFESFLDAFDHSYFKPPAEK